MGGARLLRPRPQPDRLRPGRSRRAAAFPTTEAELRRLPGIGAYTAAAIAAIAFGERAVVVDTNVERVVARLPRHRTAARRGARAKSASSPAR